MQKKDIILICILSLILFYFLYQFVFYISQGLDYVMNNLIR